MSCLLDQNARTRRTLALHVIASHHAVVLFSSTAFCGIFVFARRLQITAEYSVVIAKSNKNSGRDDFPHEVLFRAR